MVIITAYIKVLNAVKIIGGSSFTLGLVTFLVGFFVHHNLVVGIGLGAIVGAVFIFIMGVFFVATEEMHMNQLKGRVEVPKRYHNNVIPFRLK
ncbi:hypothetical protein [Bacillus sp. B15-48]|uniref:hypothetical protein n=1 Tax=Bacillus sp. B15-48 TaxID=1548601 RepID=UPI00193F2C0F|nr:hypothetical protein [Bacillus sp. B15-48]